MQQLIIILKLGLYANSVLLLFQIIPSTFTDVNRCLSKSLLLIIIDYFWLWLYPKGKPSCGLINKIKIINISTIHTCIIAQFYKNELNFKTYLCEDGILLHLKRTSWPKIKKKMFLRSTSHLNFHFIWHQRFFAILIHFVDCGSNIESLIIKTKNCVF